MFHVKHSHFLEGKIDNLDVFIYVYFQHALNAVFKCKSRIHAAGACSLEFDIDLIAFDGEVIVDKIMFEPLQVTFAITASQVIHSGYCCFTYQEVVE